MALTNIQGVRLFIGDSFEPFTFLDEEIQYFLDLGGQSVRQATIFALYAVLADLAKNKSIIRETAGHYEVWSNALDWYKLLLANITANPTLGLGSLMPYAAGIDREDVRSNEYDRTAYKGNLVTTSKEIERDGRGVWDSRYGWLDRFQYGMPDFPFWYIQ